MAKVKVAILDDYQNAALKVADWSPVAPDCEITVFDRPLGDEAAVAAALQGFDIICPMRERTPFPASLIAALPHLRLLSTTGMRNAAIDVAAAAERGIPVCGTYGMGHTTSELTWALILACARHIPTEDRNVREGRWQTTLGTDLHGKVLGILGLGRLGRQVAQVGTAFGMELIAWSQNLTEERASEAGARLVGKEELFRLADVLSIHVVLSDRSRGLVGGDELALMKSTAFLINTSRGPIVDEAALIGALNAGQIAGAGLDVFDVEPLPADHPLRQCPNAVLTPHIGYVTRDNYEIFYRHTVENIRAFLDGEPVRVIKP